MNKSRLKTILSLMSHYKPLMPYMALNCAIGLIFNIIPIAVGINLSYMLKAYMYNDFHLLIKLFAITIILLILYAILSYCDLLISHDIAYKILGLLRSKVYARLEKAVPAFGSDMTTAEMATIASQDIEYLEWFYAHTMNMGFISLIILGIVSFLFYKIHIYFVWISIIFVIPIMLIPYIFNEKSKIDGYRLRKTHSNIEVLISEAIQGMKEIESLEIYKNLEKIYKDLENKFFIAKKADSKRRKQESILTELLTFLSIILTIVVGGYLVTNGSIEKHLLIIVVISLINLYAPINLFMAMTRQFSTIFAASERVNTLLNFPIEVEEIGEDIAPEIIESIEFRNVYYKYPNSDKYILENVNFKIYKKDFVGIVGDSGSGKSTIINLIQRLAKPSNGNILINGQNIDSFSLDSWKQRVSSVRQNEYLFNASISENIVMSKLNATTEEVEEISKKCLLHQFVKERKGSYNTLIGEKAVNFSGGQRQRISISRALLKDSKILLLDEATSAMDYKTEASINEIIRKANEYDIRVLITHRLEALKNVDYILFLREGKIKKVNSLLDLNKKLK